MTWHNTTSEQQRFKAKTKNAKIIWSRWLTCADFTALVPVPPTIPRSNPKLDQNLPRSGSKRIPSITTKFRTHSDSVTFALCANHPTIGWAHSKPKHPNPDRNPNPIEIPSVGQALGQHWVSPATGPTLHGAQTTQVYFKFNDRSTTLEVSGNQTPSPKYTWLKHKLLEPRTAETLVPSCHVQELYFGG